MTITPDYLRQKKFFDPAENPHAAVTFVGVGGIGSFAAFAVAKLGVPNITLIDPDVVEAHNLPNQMYLTADEAIPKVDAASDLIDSFTETTPTSYLARITDQGWDVPDGFNLEESALAVPPSLQGLVVSGLDSMKARSDLWHRAVRMNIRCPLYIDGRLDGETIVIYAVRPWDLDDIEQYEATLLSDDEVASGECTARNIIDVGFTVAAQITRMVRLHYKDEPVSKITVVNMHDNTIAHGGWLV